MIRALPPRLARRAPLLSLIPLLALGACNVFDPYEKPGVWRPMGANDMNFALQVVRPGDLAEGRGAATADGDAAAQAIDRARHDKVKPLVNVTTQTGVGS